MKIRRDFCRFSDFEAKSSLRARARALPGRISSPEAEPRKRLSEIRNSRREPCDKADRFQRALRYRNLLDGRPGRPIHSGNLCFVSPADRTAGEFDLTTTCPETLLIHVSVSPLCTLLVYRVRANFRNEPDSLGTIRAKTRKDTSIRHESPPYANAVSDAS